MYKRVLLLVSVQRWQWEAGDMLSGSIGVEEGVLGPNSGSSCWGGGRGWGMKWYLVTSKSCLNLEKSRAMLKAFLLLTPLAMHI